jgi:hypothetical protein
MCGLLSWSPLTPHHTFTEKLCWRLLSTVQFGSLWSRKCAHLQHFSCSGIKSCTICLKFWDTLYICPSIQPSVYTSICPSVSLRLYVCLSSCVNLHRPSYIITDVTNHFRSFSLLSFHCVLCNVSFLSDRSLTDLVALFCVLPWEVCSFRFGVSIRLSLSKQNCVVTTLGGYTLVGHALSRYIVRNACLLRAISKYNTSVGSRMGEVYWIRLAEDETGGGLLWSQ